MTSEEEDDKEEEHDSLSYSVINISSEYSYNNDENNKSHNNENNESGTCHYHLVDQIIDITGISPSSSDDTATILGNCLDSGILNGKRKRSVDESNHCHANANKKIVLDSADILSHPPSQYIKKCIPTSSSDDCMIPSQSLVKIENRLPNNFLGTGANWSDRISASVTDGGIIVKDLIQQDKIFLSQRVLLQFACNGGKFVSTCTNIFMKNYPCNFGSTNRFIYFYPGAWIKLKADSFQKRVFMFNENPRKSFAMVSFDINAFLQFYLTCLQVQLYFPDHGRIPCSWLHETRHDFHRCKFCNVLTD